MNRRGRRMLDSYRETQSLSDDAQARLLAQVQTRVAAGHVARGEVDVRPPRLPTSTLSTAVPIGTVVKGVSVVLIATASVFAVRAFVAQDAGNAAPRERVAQTPPAPLPQAVAPVESLPAPIQIDQTVPTDDHERSPLPQRSRKRSATKPVTAPQVTAGKPPDVHPDDPSDTLEAEMKLLSSAHAALREGAPERALALLAEHRRLFPRGELAESRDVANILALCSAGKVELGRAEAANFLKLRPGSPFASRVRSACAAHDSTHEP